MCAQSRPAKPASHAHSDDISSHVPCPEQLRGHSPATREHATPLKPVWQVHAPSVHAPCPEQLFWHV